MTYKENVAVWANSPEAKTYTNIPLPAGTVLLAGFQGSGKSVLGSGSYKTVFHDTLWSIEGMRGRQAPDADVDYACRHVFQTLPDVEGIFGESEVIRALVSRIRDASNDVFTRLNEKSKKTGIDEFYSMSGRKKLAPYGWTTLGFPVFNPWSIVSFKKINQKHFDDIVQKVATSIGIDEATVYGRKKAILAKFREDLDGRFDKVMLVTEQPENADMSRIVWIQEEMDSSAEEPAFIGGHEGSTFYPRVLQPIDTLLTLSLVRVGVISSATSELLNGKSKSKLSSGGFDSVTINVVNSMGSACVRLGTTIVLEMRDDNKATDDIRDQLDHISRYLGAGVLSIGLIGGRVATFRFKKTSMNHPIGEQRLDPSFADKTGTSQIARILTKSIDYRRNKKTTQEGAHDAQ